ncbi:hypothetical protein TrVFT333_002262 [Trichoderma virens FT-333]|nr:hypothetical protein TrVFT333_002262 [Trichoderma virens FT-333]
MAAIGLGAEQVSPLLPAGVVVACESSPKSATISGDAKEVQKTMERICESHSDIVARLLKVDKAYHSHHMREIGSEYQAMIQPELEGKSPLKPFFFSITGDGTEQHLDASYWQKNLESPVLFKSAVARIVEHFDSVAFLESYLEAIGNLVGMNSDVDLAKLVANGACLSDLPRYPWDHEGENPESRANGDSPSWRKMIHVDSIPRVRDCKIEENVIFPAAGYISMVSEAAAQLGGHRNGYALRQVVINAAIALNDGSDATEVVTNFCLHCLTDSLDSKWWEFTISSYNGNVWMKHCSGQVAFEVDEPELVEDLQLLPRRVPKRILYNCMDMAGLRFSPLFQRLSDVRTGTVQGQATANLIDLKIVDNEHYLLHPTVIDVALQLAPIAPFRGRIKSNLYRRVPTHINSLIVHRPVTKGDIALSTSAESSGGTGEVVNQKQQIVVGGRVTLHIDGLKISQLEDVETVSNESLQNTARFKDRGSQVEAIGQGMRQIAVNIADVFSGKIDALEVLRTDDILNKMYAPASSKTSCAELAAEVSMSPSIFCLASCFTRHGAVSPNLVPWLRLASEISLAVGHITSIRLIQIFDAELAQEAFRIMQQGAHLGKLVISLRHADGRLKMDSKAAVAIKELKLEQSASYLLAGGLGGLGRSIARYLVERNARRLLAPNLKGILQASMVLRDETFSRMAYEDWNTATLPKVRGTWNLHEDTSQADINLDFFILLSSMSGTTGLAGQANYAIANTFLDSFVQYRTALGLRASCIDLGAVQDAGYIANDEALLERMNLANTNGVSEYELLEAIGRAILLPPVKSESGGFVDNNTFVLGILTTMPLGSQESRQQRRSEVIPRQGQGQTGHLQNQRGSQNSCDLDWQEAVHVLLKSEDDLDVSTSLATLNLDSSVGVEMRSWWRQAIGFDITVLEMLGMGTLEGLGWHAAQGLLKMYGEEAS